MKRFLICLTLLAATTMLQVSPASLMIADLTNLKYPSIVMLIQGWPFGARMSFTGGPPLSSYPNGFAAHKSIHFEQLVLNLSISLALCSLAYLALSNQLRQQYFRISIAELLAATFGVAVSIIYFKYNHDICIWDCRLGINGNEIHYKLLTSDRPIWHNCIAAMYIVLGCVGLVSLPSKWSKTADNNRMNRSSAVASFRKS